MKMVILLALTLSGCVTAEDRMARDDTQCQSYGVAKGTPAYVDCRARLDQNRANVQASERFGQGTGLISRIKQANE